MTGRANTQVLKTQNTSLHDGSNDNVSFANQNVKLPRQLKRKTKALLTEDDRLAWQFECQRLFSDVLVSVLGSSNKPNSFVETNCESARQFERKRWFSKRKG